MARCRGVLLAAALMLMACGPARGAPASKGGRAPFRASKSVPNGAGRSPTSSTKAQAGDAGKVVLHLELPTDSMTAGTSMIGAVVIDNNTGAPVEVASCGTGPRLQWCSETM